MRYVCLILMISNFLIIFSCNRKKDADDIQIKKSKTSEEYEDSISETEENVFSIITSKEVKSHIGDSLTVKGFIADIFLNDKVAYLNFENKFPKNTFSCTIFSDKFPEFGDIASYKGKTVEVSGRISEFKGKPQMILNTQKQIKIIK